MNLFYVFFIISEVNIKEKHLIKNRVSQSTHIFSQSLLNVFWMKSGLHFSFNKVSFHLRDLEIITYIHTYIQTYVSNISNDGINKNRWIAFNVLCWDMGWLCRKNEKASVLEASNKTDLNRKKTCFSLFIHTYFHSYLIRSVHFILILCCPRPQKGWEALDYPLIMWCHSWMSTYRLLQLSNIQF